MKCQSATLSLLKCAKFFFSIICLAHITTSITCKGIQTKTNLAKFISLLGTSGNRTLRSHSTPPVQIVYLQSSANGAADYINISHDTLLEHRRKVARQILIINNVMCQTTTLITWSQSGEFSVL